MTEGRDTSKFVEERENVEIGFWRGQTFPDEEVELREKWKWLLVAIPGSVAMMTLAAFLYNALELPWSAYDSFWGLAIVICIPLMCGGAIGIGTEKLRTSLVICWSVSFASIGLGVLCASAPYLMNVVEHSEAYVGHGWLGVFIFLVIYLATTLVGAAVARAACEIE